MHAWGQVKATWRLNDDGRVAGLLLRDAEPGEVGIPFRYAFKRRQPPRFEIPARDVGVARDDKVSGDTTCYDAVEGDGFFFRLRGSISFSKKKEEMIAVEM